MRPVDKNEAPKDRDGNPKSYSKYENARRDLIQALGEYCSYCEMALDVSLAVEHVKPKTHFPRLELKWSNFLLACTNCNSTKGAEPEDGNLDNYYWPHLDNTFLAFEYGREGIVKVAQNLSDEQKEKAKNTINLMGLDAKPNRQNYSDRRWLNRREAWNEAIDSKQALFEADSPQMRDQIIRTAKAKGYWSIWMTVFSDDHDMLSRLLNAADFKGTASDCFDANYQPVGRRGGAL